MDQVSLREGASRSRLEVEVIEGLVEGVDGVLRVYWNGAGHGSLIAELRVCGVGVCDQLHDERNEPDHSAGPSHEPLFWSEMMILSKAK